MGTGTLAISAILLSFVFNLFIYGLFSTLGALLGAAVLQRKQAASPWCRRLTAARLRADHACASASRSPAPTTSPIPREGARRMIDRARAAEQARLDSLFVGDHHSTPQAYYQNTAIMGRLLAEWGDRPFGALYLLPLWHPVLLAEQVGTLASLGRGRFILQCAIGPGRSPVPGDGGRSQGAPVALRAVARDPAPTVGRRRGLERRPLALRARAHRAAAGRAGRGLDRGRGAAGDRPRRSARRRLARGAGAHARAGTPADRSSTASGARRTASDRGSPPSAATSTSARAPRRRAPPPSRSCGAGYRGFAPEALVIGSAEQVAESFAALARHGLQRRDHAQPDRRSSESGGLDRAVGQRCASWWRTR